VSAKPPDFISGALRNSRLYLKTRKPMATSTLAILTSSSTPTRSQILTNYFMIFISGSALLPLKMKPVPPLTRLLN